jgi:carbon monoxide dehydrogenase subunit G
MQIENQFEIPLPPATAWPILMNVAQTAACFPGAGSIEQISADQYKGRVTIKLGPLAMIFTGNLRIEDREDATHSATVKANWTESKGRGNAVTVTRFALIEQDNGTRVAMKSDLQLAGQVAQYGRGVGMIAEISAQLVATFADNLRRRIQAADADGTAPAESPAAPEISGLALMAKALGNRLKR